MEIFLICCLFAVVLCALTARLSALETALLIVVFSFNVIGGRHTTTQNTEVSIQHYKVYILTTSSSNAPSDNGDVGVVPLSSEAHVGPLLSCSKSSTASAKSNTSTATSNRSGFGCGCGGSDCIICGCLCCGCISCSGIICGCICCGGIICGCICCSTMSYSPYSILRRYSVS